MNRSHLLLLALPLALVVGCSAEASTDNVGESLESEITNDGNRSDFTLITEKNCFVKVNTSDEMETSDSYCGGRGGFSIHIFDGDERQMVSIMKGDVETELNNLEATGYGFTYLPSTRVEWRASQKDAENPFALIFRQQQYIDETNKPEMLVVTKLTGDKPCIYKVVDARKHKDANQLARVAATASIAGTCPAAVPKPE